MSCGDIRHAAHIGAKLHDDIRKKHADPFFASRGGEKIRGSPGPARQMW
jgi:hypothetical protein